MSWIVDLLRTWIVSPLLVLLTLITAYAVSGLVRLIVTQHFSHLGALKCPPVPSFFWGHLQLLHDAENTNLYIEWMEQLGTIFTYRGFIGGYRLVTMDPRAITYILSRPHDYPKPGFVRDTLASMAGEQGLLVVEGDVHKRQVWGIYNGSKIAKPSSTQRRILNPSFTASQVRALAPIFYDKASKLRDIWLTLIDSAINECDFLSPVQGLSHESLLSPAKPILPLSSSSRFSLRLRSRNTIQSTSKEIPKKFNGEAKGTATDPLECGHMSPHFAGVRVDVLNWLGRATLDVIGLAGFGYAFNSLVDNHNVLAAAFAEVFSAARKFRFITVLQAWFPILYYLRSSRKSRDRSLKTLRDIGLALIARAQELLSTSTCVDDFDFRANDEKLTSEGSDSFGTLKGRDILSLLIKSNMTLNKKERMSQDEILSQISTFMAAGHETTSSALTWILYALSLNPRCQDRLRAELLSVPDPQPSLEVVQGLPYLDMVIKEGLRLYSPVSQTMRVATKDDLIPVTSPYYDKNGLPRSEIKIRKGDIISIPIQAMNKCKNLFGSDAEKFIPERWNKSPDPNQMPTIYSGILTFLQGGRSCIGYKFALLEMKVFLFVLLRSISFKLCPSLVIEKRLNVVTRPLVRSEPERGNQMPLLLSHPTLSSEDLSEHSSSTYIPTSS